MRKIKCLVLVAFLTFSIGCGKGSASSIVASNAGSASVNTTSIIEKEELLGENSYSDVVADELLVGTFKVPKEDVYVDYPDFHYRECGCCNLFMNVPDEDMYVAFSYDNLVTTPPNDLKEAKEQAFREFQDEINMCGEDTINSIVELSETETEINGRKVLSFEGKLNCGVDRVAYFVGYSFINFSEFWEFDIPYGIFGVVKDGSDTEKAEIIKNIVNEMMQSVRTEP